MLLLQYKKKKKIALQKVCIYKNNNVCTKAQEQFHTKQPMGSLLQFVLEPVCSLRACFCR